MRTLLNESFPPHLDGGAAFSGPQKIQQSRRTFSESAVFSTNDPILTEVGVDETVNATPGAGAAQANTAPACGLSVLDSEIEHLNESPAL